MANSDSLDKETDLLYATLTHLVEGELGQAWQAWSNSEMAIQSKFELSPSDALAKAMKRLYQTALRCDAEGLTLPNETYIHYSGERNVSRKEEVAHVAQGITHALIRIENGDVPDEMQTVVSEAIRALVTKLEKKKNINEKMQAVLNKARDEVRVK